MKITGGNLKGRIYSKKITNNIRPTSELVREALFNIISNLIDFDGIRVLDLCAGTGALGFESISRGAEFCNFVENNNKTCILIKEIAQTFQISNESYKILCSDVKKFLNITEDKYDLIFFDPPYFNDIYNDVLKLIDYKNILKSNGLLVVEYSKKIKLPIVENLKEIKNKNYGDTVITIFTNELQV